MLIQARLNIDYNHFARLVTLFKLEHRNQKKFRFFIDSEILHTPDMLTNNDTAKKVLQQKKGCRQILSLLSFSLKSSLVVCQAYLKHLIFLLQTGQTSTPHQQKFLSKFVVVDETYLPPLMQPFFRLKKFVTIIFRQSLVKTLYKLQVNNF